MTQQEHALMISMFVKQHMYIKMLIEVLKSRGIVSGDDLPAFEFSVNVDTRANAALFVDMTKLYLQAAKVFGIETGIEAP
ncbi:MAG: hypothetical protein ACHQT6_01840 [Candidatus Acidiferrales bacterium]